MSQDLGFKCPLTLLPEDSHRLQSFHMSCPVNSWGEMVPRHKDRWHCCHNQPTKRQRHYSEEVTCTVWSHGEARCQHTDFVTGGGCQVRALT